ncbi:cysteine synthase family protein [Brachybacterium sp. NBEC-018]|uniref:PLP-dependent cysteine synthase family protein n=1 Tax=Brachybacterium sp. NBEC-018 TaxID=2996004 RepID=UPI00217548AA|nr:cysteine synthase family protein [Brachybacterium sp. NBEC-018]UVY83565.1 cysteine synthase family protein [Brachybacterium sp. NBEC-018]
MTLHDTAPLAGAAGTDAARPIASGIIDLIGGTPLIELSRFAAARGARARILGKAEFQNPLGSVKDRIAWGIIRSAEEEGRLHPGDLIVDITSGNTGIALAAIAAGRGYRTKFYLGDNISPDKHLLLEAIGAELVTVPNSLFLDPEALDILFARAQEENPGAFIADQLSNPANPAAHYASTGPEIWRDTEGAVDVLVAGVGTGGTSAGTGRFLKKRKPEVRVVIAEPGEGSVPTEEAPYPDEIDGVHKVVDVEPEQLPGNYDAALVDEVVGVEAAEAYAAARAALHEEGLLVGPSAGANLEVAARLAQRPELEGATIVVILADTGERYLSAGVFGARPEPRR